MSASILAFPEPEWRLPNPRDPQFGSPPLPAWVRRFRQHQWAAVQEIVAAFEEGYRFVFVDAPTGSGKSLLGELARRLAGPRALYMCNTKSLQNQFVSEDKGFSYAALLKGRSNYPTRDFPQKFDAAAEWARITAADCTKTSGTACDRCEPSDDSVLEDALHCDFCLPTGEPVLTMRGMLPVEEVQEGDMVVGHDGSLHSVTATMARRHVGTIYHITSSGSPTTRMTSDHPVWASTTWDETPNWVKAADLRPGHILWSPIPSPLATYAIPDALKKLLGWYLAEGHVSEDRSVFFSLHIAETEYREEIVQLLDALGYPSVVDMKPAVNTAIVRVHNSVLAHQLKRLGGAGAHNKRIPGWLFYEGGSLRETLLAAWKGDGSTITPDTTHARYDTVSRELAHQMQALLLREGILSTWRTRPARPGHRESYMISVSGTELPKLAALLGIYAPGARNPRQTAGRIVEGRVGYPIETIAMSGHGGTVHNFAVANVESYMLPGHVMVHNCHPWQECPYERAKGRALGAQLSVINTSYFLSEANYVGRFSGWPLAIIDECDALESEVMGFAELSISERLRTKLNLDMPEKKTVAAAWDEWITNHAIPRVTAKWHQARKKKDVRGLREWRTIDRLLTQLKKLEGSVANGNWVYDGYKSGGIIFRPVRVDAIAPDLLWRHAQKFLLMSGTIISPDEMVESLGIPADQWTTVTVASTFPPENRPIIPIAIANMVYKEKETAWPLMARAVAAILDNHPDDNILVHTVSYPLTQYLVEKLNSPRVVTYTKSSERDDALATYLATPGAVLLAPSFDRGIDLAGDACRVVVVCKVPFLDLSNKQVAARLHTRGGDLWYAVQSIRTLVQMTGRGVRSADDTCTTYILDAQFLRNVWKRYRKLLPKWWTDALQLQNPPRWLTAIAAEGSR